MKPLPLRRFAVLLLLMVTVLVLCLLPVTHRWLLRGAGRLLMQQDPAQPADAIVIAVNADGAGVLAAADLVQAGLSSRVAVFSDPPAPVDREFLRRGVEYFDAAAVSMHQLRALGVTQIDVIPRAVSGSDDEGLVLPEWCEENHLGSVIFISTSDHSRRLGRILRRGMRGRPVRVTVRSSSYSEFDPDGWWHTRGGVRTEVVELEKLLLDVVLHPFG